VVLSAQQKYLRRHRVEEHKYETYLAKNDENGVDKLVELGEVEDIHPEEEGALVDIFASRVAEEVLNSLLQTVHLSVIGRKRVQNKFGE